MCSSIEDVIDEVRSQFDNVAQHLRLRGPTFVRENMYFYVGYFGEEVGVEVLVEFSPFNIYAMLFRVGQHDEVPAGYTGPHGETQKMYLEDALHKLGLPCAREETELRRLGGDWQNCPAVVSLLAELVERTWSRVVAHRATLFPSVTTPT